PESQGQPAPLPSPPQAIPSAPPRIASRPTAVPVSEPSSSPTATPARAANPPLLIRRIVEAATLPPTLQGNRILIALSPAHLGDLIIELTFQGSLLQGS